MSQLQEYLNHQYALKHIGQHSYFFEVLTLAKEIFNFITGDTQMCVGGLADR